MGLQEYKRKRDFSVTPEPEGATPRKAGRSFVVQQHAASRLHYDFRLEMEGVLESWAIPKGPSLDPADKRLAMQTEDHPVEYGDFEGVIPEGEYGAGSVIVWDRGTWEPEGDPHTDLRRGALKFTLRGEKLKGRFFLVKIRERGARKAERSWLLIKEKDAEARPGFSIVDASPTSVLSGRTLEQVAADRDRVWHPNHEGEPKGVIVARPIRPAARRAASVRPVASPRRSRVPSLDPSEVPQARHAGLPQVLAPQLATLVAEPPTGDEWLHEMKLDGYRILCGFDRGRVRLLSRQGNDWTQRFPGIAAAASELPARQALLDGEAAVLLPSGVTSFQALQNMMVGEGRGRLVYYAFDLLYLDGYDLTASPLEGRKMLLRGLLDGAPGTEDALLYSDHVVGAGPEFFDQACRRGLEGIVSKRREAPYRSGRGRDWLKVKCSHEQEVVIGGFTPPQGSRVGLGALLVGVQDGSGRLCYAGKVGTGFTAAVLAGLTGRLERLQQIASPFADRVPRSSQARWVRPELVAQVAFAEWTHDGRLRHPSFLGLREDKLAREVVRETPPQDASSPAKATRAEAAPRSTARSGQTVEVAGVRLTHADRVLYPAQGVTKHDLALFYEGIAEWILPHLSGRPTTLVRCPEGVHKQCFYQKHTGHWAPPELRRVKIREAKKIGEYLVVDDLPGLIGLVQIGILEIHTWNAVADHLEQPDRLVFDLDPDAGLAWERTVEAAHRVRAALEDLDLASFVKTTGGKGLHVVVPLQRGPEWDDCAAFAEAIAQRLVREQGESYTATMSKAKRKGKVFIDYMRNHRGATSVGAYSTRAKEGAPVSTPLRWEELGRGVRSDQFTIGNLRARLGSLGRDPWADFWKQRQRLTAGRLKAAEGR